MGLSVVKEYLPFAASRPATTEVGGQTKIDAKKIAAKTFINSAATYAFLELANRYIVSCGPYTVGVATLLLAKELYDTISCAKTEAAADRYIRSKEVRSQPERTINWGKGSEEIPSPTPTMREIIRSRPLFNALLAKAKNDPRILLKTSENGKTLLTEFVRSVNCQLNEPRAIDMAAYAIHLAANNHIIKNQRDLKKLLLAVDWPKEELLDCLALISIKAPTLLCTWPDVCEKVINRPDMTTRDRVLLGFERFKVISLEGLAKVVKKPMSSWFRV